MLRLLYRFNRYKSVDVGGGAFGGGGSIGGSDENKHEASSEEKYFYKEVNINKYIFKVENFNIV